MPLHLVFANRVEPLVDTLAETLDELWTDLAAPPDVVVPSPSAAKWLKLRLCERRSALMGLPTPTLEGFLWRALSPGERRLLRGPALAQALVPLLSRSRLDDPHFEPVRRFLLGADGAVDPRRRLQLAQEVARLFLEYGYNRPSVWGERGWAVEGLDRRWPDRPYFGGAADAPGEDWQRRLWGELFASGGTLDAGGWRTLPALHRERREAGWTPSGSPVVLFLVDKVSHFHRNLLMELSRGREVRLLLQNPCAEFWEDLDTSRRPARRRVGKLPAFAPEDYEAGTLSGRLYPAGAPGGAAEPLLLSRWGATARENTSLWSQASEYAFDLLSVPAVAEGAPPTALSVLQECLRRRHPGPAAAPLDLEDGRELLGRIPGDASVVLLAAPERGREMEAVRDQILEWLSEDPARSPSDCLVLLPDPARHRTEVRRVFGGHASEEPGRLPWTFLGEPGRESRFARGVEALGGLLQSGMDRRGVFALLRNPLCQAALEADPAEIALWERWAEGTGMLRGWDAAERSARGEVEALDVHTLRAGVLRLWAAQLADAEVALPLASGLETVRLTPWRDFDSSAQAVERLAGALERLHADLEAFAGLFPVQDPVRAVRGFVALCEAWLDTAGSEEEAVRRAWREAVELLPLQAGRDEPMGLEEFLDAASGLLPEELPGSARAFAGAVTFAPLRIGNVLPHGLVVVAGLEADAFPRAVERTSLDLLGLRRIVGDADPLQDDRHAFLSAVLAARSRLVLAWRCEDIQKDRAIEESGVLAELREAMADVTESVSEWSVSLLAREAGSCRGGRPPSPGPSWDPADAVRPQVPDPTPWRSLEAVAGETPRRIELPRLRAFVENPWLRHLRDVLGMGEDDSPDAQISDERLEIDALRSAGLRRAVFEELVVRTWEGGRPEPARVVARHLERAAWEAWSPEGGLLRRQVGEIQAWAEGLAEALASLREDWPELEVHRDLSLGVAGRPSLPAVALLGGGTVALSADLPFVLRGAGGVALLGLSRLKGSKSKRGKPAEPTRADFPRRLEAHLRVAALALSGETGPVASLHLSRDLPEEGAGWTAREDLDGSALAPWLTGIVEDMASGRDDFLPARLVAEKGASPEALREALEDSDWPDALERLFRPRLPGEPEGDAGVLEALARRRLGPFLAAEDADEDA